MNEPHFTVLMSHVSVVTMLPVIHKYNCAGMLERCSEFLLDNNHPFTPYKTKDSYVLRCGLAPRLTPPIAPVNGRAASCNAVHSTVGAC